MVENFSPTFFFSLRNPSIIYITVGEKLCLTIELLGIEVKTQLKTN